MARPRRPRVRRVDETTTEIEYFVCPGCGRVRTDGIISHRFDLADYGQALTTLTGDPTAHKVVITV